VGVSCGVYAFLREDEESRVLCRGIITASVLSWILGALWLVCMGIHASG